ncbi:MAG: hypothetical protein ACYC6L_12255 [Anaerolineae bacterium]
MGSTTSDGWADGGAAFCSTVGLLFLEASYIYHSPALADLESALAQGVSQLYWQHGNLASAILVGKPGQSVVNIYACASKDLNIDLTAGLHALEEKLREAGTNWVMVIAPPTWLLRTLLNTYQFID